MAVILGINALHAGASAAILVDGEPVAAIAEERLNRVKYFGGFPAMSILRFEQFNVEHHLAHTASAYYASEWDDAAGLTIDGSGDFVTCMFSKCEGHDISIKHRIYVPQSLGSLYTMICEFIGYTKDGDEGKVMGLAPCGEDTYRDTFDRMIQLVDSGIELQPEFFLPFGETQGMQINERGEVTLSRHYSDHVI